MLASASPGSPRNPISLPKDWQYYQPPSWTRRTRRGGMSKKTYQWCMMHSFSQTEGGMYNAAAWEIVTATSDAYAVDAMSSHDLGRLHAVDMWLGSFCTLSDLCRTAVAGRCVRELMQSCQGYAYEALLPQSMTDANTQQLVALSRRLTSITFNACNALTDIGVIAVSENCPHLMHIRLYECMHVTDVGLQSLAQLCTQLATVCLDGCRQMTDVGLQSLAQHCGLLTDISVSECDEMTDTGLTALASNCPQLKYINTQFEALTNAGVRAVALHCHQLKIFDMHGCSRVTNSGLQALTRKCRQLESISFGCTEVGDVGLRAVAYNCSTRLTSINMDGCEVTTRGLTTLAALCPNLTKIEMRSCYIGMRSVMLLASNCTQLSFIDMCDTPLTETGLRALVTHCQQLNYIEIINCRHLKNAAIRLAVAIEYPHLRKCLVDNFYCYPDLWPSTRALTM